MTRTTKHFGVVLLGLALGSPAASSDTQRPIQHGKGDHATVGSAPQVLTAAELDKMNAIRMLAPGQVPEERDVGPLPAKPAPISTVGPALTPAVPMNLDKPMHAPRFDIIDLTGRPARPKPPEVSTREPAAPGLTAAEIAKLAALRRNSASPDRSGRSER